MRKIFRALVVLFFVITSISIYAQTELVPVSNRVYDFLKRMQVKGVIPEFNSSSLPIDRRTVGEYIKKISNQENNLSSTDKAFLKDYFAEFDFETSNANSSSYSFIENPSITDLFDNNKQKYLYSYLDENARFFVDGVLNVSARRFTGSSFDNSLTLAEVGVRLRGTLYDNVGFYIRLSNGQQIQGNEKDKIVATPYDSRLKSSSNFIDKVNFDSYEGYLRYATTGNWLALTIGREALTSGFGYGDKLFISSNIAPFDFIKLDVKYKALSYTYFYGTIKGDSAGVPLESKSIISNRLNINLNKLKIGFFEAIITSNRAINFTYLNPISFLVSANFSSQINNNDNSLMGFDIEYSPFRNFALQTTLLVDDIDFGKLSDVNSLYSNRFGYQAGLIWDDFISIDNLRFTLEYTRINPLVYTHRSNKSNYTHWSLPIGHHLTPNSDEIFMKLDYDLSHRLKLSSSYVYQRSANGYIEDKGVVSNNYGGDLFQGKDDGAFQIDFLKGNRFNKHTINFDLYWEPIKQYSIKLHISKVFTDNIFKDALLNDNIFYLTFGIDF